MTNSDANEDTHPDPSTSAELRSLVEVQRDTIVAIATGSPLASYRKDYRRRRASLRAALQSRALPNPFMWPDLDIAWAWAKQWTTYAERRAEVAKLITPLLDQLDTLENAGRVDDWGGSSHGWAQLEQRLTGLRNELDHATALDDYQDVGRRSREVIIDVVNLVFEPDMVPDNKEQPKASDAKARFDYITDTYVPGSSHAELRKLMRAAWNLAQKVTHGDIPRVSAFAAAQATVLVARTLAEMQREGRPG